jgi:hypothetical protein
LAEHPFQSCLNLSTMVTNAEAGTSNLPLPDGVTVGAVAMVWKFRSKVMDQWLRGTQTRQSTSMSTTTSFPESLLRKARSMPGANPLRGSESRPRAVLGSGLRTQTTLLFLAATPKSSRRLNICHISSTRGVTAACLNTLEVVSADGWSLRMSEGRRSYSPMVIVIWS